MSDEGGGAPAWIMTFADLMSLLMTFFVLLLSFSEMDVLMYKQIAGSMKDAFGVQREIKVREIPKGTSIIAKEFSPGRPDPTPVDEIRQKTVDESKRHLEQTDSIERPDVPKTDVEIPEEDVKRMDSYDKSPFVADIEKIKKELKDEIEKGAIKISTKDKSIILTIQEKGSFSSGSDKIHKEFSGTVDKIGRVLTQVGGEIHVSGHTDDLPIQTDQFRSNWDLSAARAVSMISAVVKSEKNLDEKRFVVNGYGDTKPLQPNTSPENRALNRRVEITIVQDAQALQREETRKQQQAEEAKRQQEEAQKQKAEEAERKARLKALEKSVETGDPNGFKQ